MWWLCWTAAALAGDPPVEVRSALASGNVRAARVAISELDASLGDARSEVSSEALIFRYQAHAAIFDLQSRDRDVLEAFRRAWIVAPTGKPNRDVLTRPDLVDTFLAVQSEVFQLDVVDLRWMKLPEDAPVRVDGMAVGTQPVFRGRHHVQVQCADGSWSSRWTTFSQPEDWAHACPEGALAVRVVAAPAAADPTVLDIEMPEQLSSTPLASEGEEGTPPGGDESIPDDETPLPSDASWYARSVSWVRNFELPRPPRGRLLMAGPVVGLGTGGELQFVPGGDAGGFFTTLSATHMPVHGSANGVGLLRLSGGELGLGYQPSRARAVGFEVRGGTAVYHDSLRYTDGYVYLTGAAGARWDAPGTGRFVFAGLAYAGNFSRGFVAPRAAVGWQF